MIESGCDRSLLGQFLTLRVLFFACITGVCQHLDIDLMRRNIEGFSGEKLQNAHRASLRGNSEPELFIREPLLDLNYILHFQSYEHVFIYSRE